MNYIITIITFIVVLFFYIHINHHYKTSNDMEVYLIENPSKDRLEDVCNLRQPFTFNFNNENLKSIFNLDYLIKYYGQFDVNVRKIDEDDEDTELYLPLPLKKTEVLIKKENVYITENNNDFISETGLLKYLNQGDELLKPPLLSNTYYDFISGSNNSITPLRYSINYRNYIYVTKGKVKVKLICPQDSKYLDKIKDYDNFEFRSNVNIWTINEASKIRILDVELNEGQILYIPAYWWYTIKFDELSIVCSFQYRTYMNNIAIIPDLVLNFFQRQNTKRKSIKSLEQKKPKEEPVEIKLDKEEEEEEEEEEVEVEEEEKKITKKILDNTKKISAVD